MTGYNPLQNKELICVFKSDLGLSSTTWKRVFKGFEFGNDLDILFLRILFESFVSYLFYVDLIPISKLNKNN